jgi:alpha-beta hydrolase superfamily lysophospholipase
MTKPTQVATLVVSAFACVCAIHASLYPATAGPPSPAAATSATMPTIEPQGRVYLFRGFVGVVFSRGTDRLAERIEQAGLTANVSEAMMCGSVTKDAIRDYREKPAPIILIGHSMGAACALNFADALNDEKIPVSLLVTTDPSRVSQDVPVNVERYINIYQSDSWLGGRDVKPSQGFRGHYASYDVIKHTELTHTNMEKSEAIQEQVIAKILLLAATPAKAEAEPLPIRYVVPADADIELWDSGMAVFAHPGDTTQSLATLYHVPTWALTQINHVTDTAALTPGQRLVVPRRLVPSTAAADGAASSQTPAKR